MGRQQLLWHTTYYINGVRILRPKTAFHLPPTHCVIELFNIPDPPLEQGPFNILVSCPSRHSVCPTVFRCFCFHPTFNWMAGWWAIDKRTHLVSVACHVCPCLSSAYHKHQVQCKTRTTTFLNCFSKTPPLFALSQNILIFPPHVCIYNPLIWIIFED